MSLKSELENLANPEKATVLQKFFKTGKGQYGEGDVFLGITVPQSRIIAKSFSDISFEEIKQHLESKIHEERLVALLILVEKYKKSDNKKEIVDFYLDNLVHVNNWDLVDLSADKILGDYLFDKDKKILHELAKSRNLWEKRVAIVSTFSLIKKNKFDNTFKIIEMLMKDEHDLIHKACGWMLREIGKRNERYLDTFLEMHYKKMPRTMLRYAIERMDKSKKEFYMKK